MCENVTLAFVDHLEKQRVNDCSRTRTTTVQTLKNTDLSAADSWTIVHVYETRHAVIVVEKSIAFGTRVAVQYIEIISKHAAMGGVPIMRGYHIN